MNELENKFSLKELQNSTNIVDLYDEDDSDLVAIGKQVIDGYKIDKDSRKEWEDEIEEALNMDKQLMEKKTFPWPGAANIKFPLITETSVDFAANTTPSIIRNNQVVKCGIVGRDKNDLKYDRAERVAEYMSYQLLHDDKNWKRGTAQLIQMSGVMGTAFRKVYYDEIKERTCFEAVSPLKVVVNYHSKSLEDAPRITHVLTQSQNEIIRNQRKGLYSNSIDVEALAPKMLDSKGKVINEGINDPNHQFVLLEQICWLDLDGDDLSEPYIVTVELESGKVLRIYNCFEEIVKKGDKVLYIKPKKYWIDYHCMYSSDGGFYSRGFGSLLLPINKAINSTMNQLIDSGTLSTSQTMLIGKGARLKNGSLDLAMGEIKVVDCASGTDLKDNIFPIPYKEPSQTLYNLLELLIQTGKDLAQSTAVQQGQQPAQNVAANTVNTLLEQSTAVPNNIREHIWQSLADEFQLLYDLNCYYPNPKHYKIVLDDDQANYKQDFEENTLNVFPIGDAQLSSMSQRLVKAQMLQTMPTADRREVDLYIAHTLQLDPDQLKRLFPPKDPNAPPPPPDQKDLAQAGLFRMQAQQIAYETGNKMEEAKLLGPRFELEQKQAEANYVESQARVWKMQKDGAHGDAKLAIAGGKMQQEASYKALNLEHKRAMDIQNTQLNDASEVNKANKTETDLKTKVMDNATKLKVAEIAAHAKNDSRTSKVSMKEPNPIYSNADIEHTAKLKGMSVGLVKSLLGV